MISILLALVGCVHPGARDASDFNGRTLGSQIRILPVLEGGQIPANLGGGVVYASKLVTRSDGGSRALAEAMRAHVESDATGKRTLVRGPEDRNGIQRLADLQLQRRIDGVRVDRAKQIERYRHMLPLALANAAVALSEANLAALQPSKGTSPLKFYYSADEASPGSLLFQAMIEGLGEPPGQPHGQIWGQTLYSNINSGTSLPLPSTPLLAGFDKDQAAYRAQLLSLTGKPEVPDPIHAVPISDTSTEGGRLAAAFLVCHQGGSEVDLSFKLYDRTGSVITKLTDWNGKPWVAPAELMAKSDLPGDAPAVQLSPGSIAWLVTLAHDSYQDFSRGGGGSVPSLAAAAVPDAAAAFAGLVHDAGEAMQSLFPSKPFVFVAHDDVIRSIRKARRGNAINPSALLRYLVGEAGYELVNDQGSVILRSGNPLVSEGLDLDRRGLKVALARWAGSKRIDPLSWAEFVARLRESRHGELLRLVQDSLVKQGYSVPSPWKAQLSALPLLSIVVGEGGIGVPQTIPSKGPMAEALLDAFDEGGLTVTTSRQLPAILSDRAYYEAAGVPTGTQAVVTQEESDVVSLTPRGAHPELRGSFDATQLARRLASLVAPGDDANAFLKKECRIALSKRNLYLLSVSMPNGFRANSELYGDSAGSSADSAVDSAVDLPVDFLDRLRKAIRDLRNTPNASFGGGVKVGGGQAGRGTP